MRRIPQCRYLVSAAVLSGLLALPAVGAASSSAGNGSGGAAPGGQASHSGTVSASGNGITITSRAAGFYQREMRFKGSALRRDAGGVVEIERSGKQTGGSWVASASATVAQNGSFTASWRVGHWGQFAIRAILARKGSGEAASSWPAVNVTVYRVSIGTIYGPGLWGRHTACGEKLRHTTLGVANRKLPCGMRVSLYYRGQTIVVPVIDRGPYANGANWDLTEATAHALGMDGTAKVGAVTVARG